MPPRKPLAALFLFQRRLVLLQMPHEFGERFLEYALSIRDDLPKELIGQSLNPWLDQVALPLVVHSFGGGRSVLPEGLLDGDISCHYRALPLMYAREDEKVIAFWNNWPARTGLRRR